jgi:hypothetical protein
MASVEFLGRGVNFPVGDGQQMRDVRLEMAPVGTITGRVVDENGRPVGHAACPRTIADVSRGSADSQLFSSWCIRMIGASIACSRWFLESITLPCVPKDPTRRSATLSLALGSARSLRAGDIAVITTRILPTGETFEETYNFVYYGGTTEAKRATVLNVTPGATSGCY